MQEFAFACIKSMSAEYNELWLKLRNEYIDKLNSGALIQNIAFTPHDYNHHCCNIYRIISKVPLKPTAYKILSEEELFILNAAVMLHDISMTEISYDRKCHSFESVRFLIEERESRKNRILMKISSNTFNSICNLIKAHSDEKDNNGNSISYSIDDLPEEDDEDKRIKVLAGILRLADELDISSDRLDMENFTALERAIKKREDDTSGDYDHEQLVRDLSSYKHWLICRYIARTKMSNDNITHINIFLDDNYLLSLDNYHTPVKEVITRRDKIQDALDTLNNVVFHKCGTFYADISYVFDEIKVISRNPSIADVLNRNAFTETINQEDRDKYTGYSYLHNGTSYNEYVPPSTESLENMLNEFHFLFKKYADMMEKQYSDYSVDEELLIRAFIRVDQAKLHYKMYHKGTLINELKETALLVYWLISYKPISIRKRHDVYSVSNVNEHFSIYLITCVMHEHRAATDKPLITFSSKEISDLLYILQNRDISKDALTVIIEAFVQR